MPTPVLQLAPIFSITEEYSDNFNLTRIDRQENFRTLVTPGFNLLYNTPVTQGLLTFQPSLVYDTSTDDFSLFYDFLGQLGWQPTPLLTLIATDVLVHNDAVGEADQLGLRRERGKFTTHTFELELKYLVRAIETRPYYRLSNFWDDDGSDTTTNVAGATIAVPVMVINTVELGYEYLTSETTDDGSDVSGHTFTASVSRQIGRFLSGGIAGSYALRTSTNGVRDDYQIAGGYAYATYQTPELLTASLSFGYTVLDSEEFSDNSSLTSQGSIVYRFGRATLLLEGDIGFSETFARGENFGVVLTRGVRGTVSYALTPLITVSAGGYYRENEFTGVAGDQPERTEHLWGASAALGVRLRPWLLLTLEYAYRDLSSPIPADEYRENRGRVTLQATF